MTYRQDYAEFPLADHIRYHSGKDCIVQLRALSVGWLDGEHPTPKVDARLEYLDELWAFVTVAAFETRGIHECPFCKKNILIQKEGSNFLLGSSLLVLLPPDRSIAYVTPNLIWHYIAHHAYVPGECFANAILAGPKSNSLLYNSTLKALNVPLSVLPVYTGPQEELEASFRIFQYED